VTALITGEDNPSARRFATREHFHAVYSGVKNKAVALEELCAAHGLIGTDLACVFDDVNDLGMAEKCGVRVLVRRDSSPMLKEYVARRKACDYVTAVRSHEHAVRETAELLLGLMGAFDQVVASRVAWDADYAGYFAARQAVVTHFDTGARV
jgi:3-deoxy-D-manno-octulosonate 8-phosphate phosphatase (KDO 8-P phosphatase)